VAGDGRPDLVASVAENDLMLGRGEDPPEFAAHQSCLNAHADRPRPNG
jgi:hypothetical protein